jgi:hypothetical protein
MRGQEIAQLGASRRLVVHEQRTNQAGTWSRTTVPKTPDFRRTPSP